MLLDNEKITLKRIIIPLLEEALKAVPDQALIKTYGMHSKNGAVSFTSNLPDHDKGLFFSGGVFPVYWSHEMDTAKFINSLEYRKLFVNNVILSIIEHCELHGMEIC